MLAVSRQQGDIIPYLGQLVEFNLEDYNNTLEGRNNQFNVHY
jgi:hypothetical protein